MDEKYLYGMKTNGQWNSPPQTPSFRHRKSDSEPRTPPVTGNRQIIPGQRPWLQEMIRKKTKQQESDNWESSDPAKIIRGMVVEHQRFGTGKVLQIEGSPQDRKATVFFQQAGQKQLLLKFARLKIVG